MVAAAVSQSRTTMVCQAAHNTVIQYLLYSIILQQDQQATSVDGYLLLLWQFDVYVFAVYLHKIIYSYYGCTELSEVGKPEKIAHTFEGQTKSFDIYACR